MVKFGLSKLSTVYGEGGQEEQMPNTCEAQNRGGSCWLHFSSSSNIQELPLRMAFPPTRAYLFLFFFHEGTITYNYTFSL